MKTERVTLRQLTVDDAEFIYRLLNEPSWRQYIGDKNIKTLADARNYIQTGPQKMYADFGFGLFLVERRQDQIPLGLCGLIKREGLEDVDLGFAFLPEFWGQGYARESAQAVMNYGKATHGLAKLVAITLANNHASSGLLKRLGFEFERTTRLSEDDDELQLFSINL